ncbi:MAG: sulfatase-like hydrolase/transferase [Candidatus Omnitrophica bacterium]|nr:sulfatase-like hydrolase/transferase [Candidatus Omnitrophota bacterium]
MRRTSVFHPFLFALFPILSAFVHNSSQMQLSELWLPLSVVLAGTSLLWILLRMGIEDRAKVGLLLSGLIFFFFSYGHVIGLIHGARLGGWMWGRHRYVLLVFGLLLVSHVFLCLRTRRNLETLTRFLNTFSLCLVGISLITGLAQFGGRIQNSEGPDPSGMALKAPAAKPDIYYLILDGYGRQDVLQNLYDYDNSEFLGFLKQKGFYIASQSYTNYPQTHLSLSSSLNFEYLDELARRMGPRNSDRSPLVKRMRDNRIMQLLKSQGYRTLSFDTLVKADVHLSYKGTVTEFQNVLLNTTPVPYLMERLRLPFSRFQYDAHRNQMRFILEKLPELPQEDGPIFVFAHVLLPHPPFVLGAQGEALSVDRKFHLYDGSHFFELGGTRKEYLEGYRNQVRYVNSKVNTAVERILQESVRPVVLIIQGDHGPGMYLDHSSLEKTHLAERMAILNAYYLPGAEARLYPRISPVNSFRVLLNHVFGADLELLPDRSHFAPHTYPYDLTEVTDQLR